MRYFLFVAVMVSTAGVFRALADDRPLYFDSNQPVEMRVDDLLSRLTLEEKIKLVHADCKFGTAENTRLGIPRRWLSDGPNGVREDIGPATWAPAGRTDDFSTAMPVPICLAATWDPDLAHAEGAAIGEEARARGKDIMLAPCVNIMRTPLSGRCFEFLGEDPFLTARMAVGYIKGQQNQDVASCVKHFAVNNQEYARDSINVEVDERALLEIYLPAFAAAVKEAKVWTVMGAYNQFRGQHCCENDYLLNKILKKEWNFQGLVVSDWNGTHSTSEAEANGLDLEMGTDIAYDQYYFAQPYYEGLKKGTFSTANLDDKVRRNLRVMFATHVFDPNRKTGAFNTPDHQKIARQVAEEGITLLKNKDRLLPLDLKRIKSIAVIGENAVRPQTHGGGSSEIKSVFEITPLQGIISRAGEQVNVNYSEGYRKDGDEELSTRAVAAAKSADVVIYIGGLNHDYDNEGQDRKDLKLPAAQDKLIQKIVAANPKTVVVLEGTVVDMSAWVDRVPALLEAWYSGMEGGNALAGILFGDVNPSGKLPCTFPKNLADSPAHALGAYPGTSGTTTYAEGLLVGYRWFDSKKIEPQFPFGHGLSYTTFEYSGLKLYSKPGAEGPVVAAQFDVTNKGNRAGAEVAQLYIHQNAASCFRPDKELKGFKKLTLKPGEKQTITIPLSRDAFAFYDPEKQGWVSEKGGFEVSVGSSSRDIRLRKQMCLSETTVEK